MVAGGWDSRAPDCSVGATDTTADTPLAPHVTPGSRVRIPESTQYAGQMGGHLHRICTSLISKESTPLISQSDTQARLQAVGLV